MVRLTHRVKPAVTTNEKIGARVGAFLGTRSAAWLGEQIGMSRQNARRLIKGELEWRVETLERVAQALGIRMADLMPDADPGLPPDEQAVLAVFRTGGYRALIALAVTHLPDP